MRGANGTNWLPYWLPWAVFRTDPETIETR